MSAEQGAPAHADDSAGTGGVAGSVAGAAAAGATSSAAGAAGADAAGGSSGAGTGGVAATAGAGGAAGASGAGGAAGASGAGGAAGSGGAIGSPNVFATAADVVEVFVNGSALGKSTVAGSLLAVAAQLSAGRENVIALRATKGTAAKAYVQAELDGAFGKAGTSAQWKAKPATSADELSGSGWAASAYDDGGWSVAKDVSAKPSASELTSGPARGIWTSSASDTAALFRLRFYIPPAWSADQPYGFGSAVTGGDGGTTVTVKTAAELAAEVSGNGAKIIRVSGTLDFTGSEGPVTKQCCYQQQCPSGESELITDDLGACKSANKATFDCTFDKAGTTPLAVGSNKTIVGVGPDATIKGKGLKLVNDVSNVIIRNLTITRINPQVVWGGDAITVSGAKNVWIDHNRISLIGRQFLVTGYEPAMNVTVSYNEFDGNTPYSATCNGSHYWTMLFAGSDDRITLMGNWIHQTSGRGPHAGGLDTEKVNVQLVNDYYQSVPGHAADSSLKANLLFEGTYFQDVKTPFQVSDGFNYAPLASNLASTNAACNAALGRSCVANASSAANAAFPLDQSALNALAPFKGSVLLGYPAMEVPFSVPELAGPGHI